MIVEFTETLRQTIAAYTTKTFTRSYIVINGPDEIKDGKWFIMSAGDSVSNTGNTQLSTLEVYLIYQRSLPKAASGKPIHNLAFLDGCVAEVDSVINLFRNPDDVDEPNEHTGKFACCGQYAQIGGFNFAMWERNPLFDAVTLRDFHIFSSVIRLTYRG